MKMFAFAFAILLAGVCAVPSEFEVKANERFVAGIIADAIADVSQNIQEAGLDPLHVNSVNEVYRLPVTNLVNVELVVENLVSTGLSNIVINRANYAILTSRLTLDVSLPRILIAADAAEVYSLIMGWSFKAGVSGSLVIVEPRINADVRINIGIISGISIRSISIDFTLAGVESNVNLNINGVDYSDAVNQFAGVTLPGALAANRAEINELLEYLALIILEDAL